MGKTYLAASDELGAGIYRRILRLIGKNGWTWPSVGAAAGLSGGVLSIVLGGLDWAVVGLVSPAGGLGPLLDTAGSVLFILPLPLLALGAHCLDLLERKTPRLPAAPRRGR